MWRVKIFPGNSFCLRVRSEAGKDEYHRADVLDSAQLSVRRLATYLAPLGCALNLKLRKERLGPGARMRGMGAEGPRSSGLGPYSVASPASAAAKAKSMSPPPSPLPGGLIMDPAQGWRRERRQLIHLPRRGALQVARLDPGAVLEVQKPVKLRHVGTVLGLEQIAGRGRCCGRDGENTSTSKH
jgi:hypothetical protein